MVNTATVRRVHGSQLTAPSAADVEAIIVDGRFGAAAPALHRLDLLLPSLDAVEDPQAALVGLYARALLLHVGGAATGDGLRACDLLERAAVERHDPLWTAIACALRAAIRLDAGDAAAALGDLARVDLEQVGPLDNRAGYRLLDAVAGAFTQLRLFDRAAELRTRLEAVCPLLEPVDRLTHWSQWSTELFCRALEPVARGEREPDSEVTDEAVRVAERVATAGEVPGPLAAAAHAVLAGAASYRARPDEALRLLQDVTPGGGPTTATIQIAALAATRAHSLAGSPASARAVDDRTGYSALTLPALTLEVCRARERYRLEARTGGDAMPALTRLSDLLARLAWQGLDLVTDTARHTLEHQAVRAESRTDALTGVGNRRALDEDLRTMLRHTPLPVAVVIVDVDDFKAVNDRHTHVVGDEVLRRVATSLAAGLRAGDRLVRYGGDEFVLLLPHTGDQDARQVAARMSAAIADLPWSELADGLAVRVTTGSAALWSLTERRPDRDAERLLRRADEALLEAKRGREHQAQQAPWHRRPSRRHAAVIDLSAVDMRGPGS